MVETAVDLSPIGPVMSHIAAKDDRQISRLHRIALCEEIGERLRFELDLYHVATPPHLLRLMKRFEQSD